MGNITIATIISFWYNFIFVFTFYSGARPMNCFGSTKQEKFGCHRLNCTSWRVSVTNRISINCCHLRRNVAKIRQRHWSFPFTFIRLMVWYIAIRATIFIQGIRITTKRRTTWKSMRTSRVPSVGPWPKIYIVPNWNRLMMSLSGRTSEISTIISTQIRRRAPARPMTSNQNYNFAKY